MRRLVSESHSLIVFPEGTRSVDGRVGRFKKGSFLVAMDAGLPVVPVSVSGSRHVMRKGRLMVCPGEVELTVHEPIPSEGVDSRARRRARHRGARIVRRNVDESPDAPAPDAVGDVSGRAVR